LRIDFRDWPYSSYHALLSDRPTQLRRDEVLDWFNGRIEFDAIHALMTDEKEIAALLDGAEE
jgi:hypothetical protein